MSAKLLFTDIAAESPGKGFSPWNTKSFIAFWQVMWVNSSKLKIGRSLSSLPTKCQQWGRQIYLSVGISWEGQLSIKLEIDDPQTSCSIWGKQQIQGTNQSKGEPESSKMDWETSANDLWLIWVWNLSPEQPGDASQCQSLPGNIHSWSSSPRGGTEWLCLKITSGIWMLAVGLQDWICVGEPE